MTPKYSIQTLFCTLVCSLAPMLFVSCTFRVGVLPERTPTVEAAEQIPVSDTSDLTGKPTSTPYVPTQQEQTSTPYPDPVQPSRSEARFLPEIVFATQPDTSQGQLIFPYAVPQIYAIWSYENMRDGLVIHREWYKDGELWIVREEPWDFAKYGANGTVRDVSIWDFEKGLESGRYQLRLFIDRQEQALGQGEAFSDAFFEIGEPNDLSPRLSPDGKMLAIVDPPGILYIESGGERDEILKVDEISSLVWYPDGKHLIYGLRDRSEQEFGFPVGLSDELWVVNVTTGETYPLVNQSDRATWSGWGLRDPQISPDGAYIAAIEGTGFADACFVHQMLWVKAIAFVDGQLRETGAYNQHDFEPFGLPENEHMYIDQIIEWESPTQLEVEFRWTCGQENLDGIYLLDLDTLTAEKLAP